MLPRKMNYPLLARSRWQVAEFIFLEYRRGIGVLLDVGPFPEDPDEKQTDEAYQCLQQAGFDFLSLTEANWTLDLDRVTARFSLLRDEGLSGVTSVPPAFATTSTYSPSFQRFFNKRAPAQEHSDLCYFLRANFNSAGDTNSTPIIFPMDEDLQKGMPVQGVEGETEPESAQATVEDERLQCFYSKLSVEKCADKLTPFIVPRARSSSIIRSPQVGQTYEAVVNGNEFRLKAPPTHNYVVYFSGVLRADTDGGSNIVGDVGVEPANASKRYMAYAGVALSLSFSLLALRWLPAAVLAVLFIIAAAFILTQDDAAEESVLKQEKAGLLDFVQQLFESEAVEYDE